jgi:hypothetical protein
VEATNPIETCTVEDAALGRSSSSYSLYRVHLMAERNSGLMLFRPLLNHAHYLIICWLETYYVFLRCHCDEKNLDCALREVQKGNEAGNNHSPLNENFFAYVLLVRHFQFYNAAGCTENHIVPPVSHKCRCKWPWEIPRLIQYSPMASEPQVQLAVL